MVSTLTTDTKWTPSRKYMRCALCGSTEKEHKGRGLCEGCFYSSNSGGGVVERFLRGDTSGALMSSYLERYQKGKHATMNISGDTLFSYEHPIAIRRGWDTEYPYLINADVPGWSPTTQNHMGYVLRHQMPEPDCFRVFDTNKDAFMVVEQRAWEDAPEVSGSFHKYWSPKIESIGPQVSFSAVKAAGFDPHEIEFVEVCNELWVPAPTKANPDYKEHLLGGVVFRGPCRKEGSTFSDEPQQTCKNTKCRRKWHYYVSAIDNNEPRRYRSYFLTKLPRVVEGMEDAYDSLVPDEVREFRRNPDSPAEVRRQGDIFMIPTPTDFTSRHLPRPTYKRLQLHDTAHTATEGRKNGTDYARKVVRHEPYLLDERPTWSPVRRRAPQHAPVRLQNRWHRTYRNLGIESFNVDETVAYVD